MPGGIVIDPGGGGGGEGGDPPPPGQMGPLTFLRDERAITDVSCAAPAVTSVVVDTTLSDALACEVPQVVDLGGVEMEEVA